MYREEIVHAGKYCTSWWEWYLVEKSKNAKQKKSTCSAHQTNGRSENTRKSMDNLHYWFKPVHQCATPIPIILKRIRLVLKQFKDSVGGITASEGVGERVLGQVYPNLLGIVIKCIDNESKVRRRHGYQCRRYFVTEKSGRDRFGGTTTVQ
jgi:hypothetical protein